MARAADHRDRGGPRAAQVLVRKVQDHLVVRVGVDRRHPGTLDSPLVVQHLGDGCEAVRRARGVRDDAVTRGVVVVAVDAEHEREIRIRRRCTDDDPLGPCLEVLRRASAVGETAGRLDHDLCAEAVPGERRGIALGRDRDLHAVHHDGGIPGLHLTRVLAVHRVVLEQVRQGLRVRQVVDSHDLDLAVPRRPEHQSSDAAEAIDTDANRHVACLLTCGRIARTRRGPAK
jgi:hypothetical protein